MKYYRINLSPYYCGVLRVVKEDGRIHPWYTRHPLTEEEYLIAVMAGEKVYVFIDGYLKEERCTGK